MIATPENFQQDIENINQISIVPSLLNVICQTTGMGFAAIARVTEERWITCSVKDDILFGLKPGDELEIKTTICNEIRQLQKSVVIDHVATDPEYNHHHTPAKYGFQSYISVPIIRRDGTFFGTLCAIDPSPRNLKNLAVTGMFEMFAELISFHLDAIEQVHSSTAILHQERAVHQKIEDEQKVFTDALEKKVHERTRELEEKNSALEKMNNELQSFAYISSHDLQEPLRKIQIFATLITVEELHNLSDKGKNYFVRMQVAANRMQNLISDLLVYSRTNVAKRKFEMTDLNAIIEDVRNDLQEELADQRFTIEVGSMCKASVIPFQFRQLLHNLISNSLKFANPERPSYVKISSEIVSGRELNNDQLLDEVSYCHIVVRDNGIGFDQIYNDKIFELFQRLHHRTEYTGTGIGLAIVKKIVENHHGIITASGVKNEGARFDIYFPVDN